MNHRLRVSFWTGLFVVSAAVGMFAGCGPTYRELRQAGLGAMARGDYGPARFLLKEADNTTPRRVENLHDLGACSIMLAKQQFDLLNHAAALRELDAAVAYYSRAIDVHPGHQPSLEGKNIALELKGQFDEALRHAEWAARFVGPSAKQFVFLARELEQRGDKDGALLRYRQAVRVEPNAVEAHIAFAKFLLRSHNESAAVQHLQTAYRLDPANQWVATELAQRSAVPTLASQESAAP